MVIVKDNYQEASCLLLTLMIQGLIMQSVLQRSQVQVVRPQGHFNAANASQLEQQLCDAVVACPEGALLVDMGQVESLDSAGLMVLVSALNLAKRMNRRFYLATLSAPIRIIFEMTQLDRVFHILPTGTELSAIAA